MERWNEIIAKFAEATGKSVEEITKALEPIVGAPSDAALEILADEESATTDDLKGALVNGECKIPVGVFRKNLHILRGQPAKQEKTETAPQNTGIVGFPTDILPSVPDDESFIAALKIGGTLKVEQADIIAALKVSLAKRVSLFELPERLRKAMEDYADTLEEPCSESYYQLLKMIGKRDYGEVLSVIGVSAHFVTEAKKKAFLAKVDEHIWISLHDFQQVLNSWNDIYTKQNNNLGAIVSLIQGGGIGAGMQIPDTSMLRDASESVADRMNKVFAGPGIPVARALAVEALGIKEILSSPSLPLSIGAPSKEVMLKQLGLDAAANDYIRLEQNLIRYVLGIIGYQKVTPGQQELSYLMALLQLGSAIPWDKLLRDSTPTIERSGRSSKY